mmetsp:Transcript_11881/g.29270  ORF Transcript_11881/g.29270 Transcript_11881/m.29270 type:complete len:283 (+) Transcript_11881:2944-3792(+)
MVGDIRPGAAAEGDVPAHRELRHRPRQPAARGEQCARVRGRGPAGLRHAGVHRPARPESCLPGRHSHGLRPWMPRDGTGDLLPEPGPPRPAPQQRGRIRGVHRCWRLGRARQRRAEGGPPAPEEAAPARAHAEAAGELLVLHLPRPAKGEPHLSARCRPEPLAGKIRHPVAGRGPRPADPWPSGLRGRGAGEYHVERGWVREVGARVGYAPCYRLTGAGRRLGCRAVRHLAPAAESRQRDPPRQSWEGQLMMAPQTTKGINQGSGARLQIVDHPLCSKVFIM